MNSLFGKGRQFPWEAFIWLAALGFLALANPEAGSHFTLCPLKTLGINSCPGCNIGHSITFFLHGYVYESWATHWLGIPAVMVLVSRSISLLYGFWKSDAKYESIL